MGCCGPPSELSSAAPGGSRVAEWVEHRTRILVVDDDAALRLLLRTTLASDEYAVEEAASAEQAADFARFWRPKLVVLDVALPGASGLELCSMLAESLSFGMPKVILLTGGETSSVEAEAAGASAILRKPFSPLELVNLIDRLEREEPVFTGSEAADTEQLLIYARDLSRLVPVERAQ